MIVWIAGASCFLALVPALLFLRNLAHFELGMIYDRLKSYPEAVAAFERVIALNPRHAQETNASLFDIVNVQNWPAASASRGAVVPVARSLPSAGAAPLAICFFSPV